MQLLNSASTDTVSGLLSSLTVQSSVYCLSELRAPWGFQVSGANVAKFHLVLEGACLLKTEGADPVRLAAGELVILSRGERHAMYDATHSPTPHLDELIALHKLDDQARLRSGGDGALTRLLCGGFAPGNGIPAPLLSMLPPVLHFDAVSAGVLGWLEPVFGLVRDDV